MWRKSWQQTLCLLAALSCLGPYLALAFFARPAVDDYCYAVRLRHLGFIEAQRWYYFHWTGRYAATALLNLSELTGALEGNYWAYLVATITLTTAAVRLLLSRVSRAVGQPTDGWFVTSLAVALVVLILSRISNPVESFYWLPGVFTYQLGVVGVLATTALLLSLSHEPPGPLKVEVAMLGVLGIVTAGLSEACSRLAMRCGPRPRELEDGSRSSPPSRSCGSGRLRCCCAGYLISACWRRRLRSSC
jgi:hypothetical protein